ncbi:MAG: LysE family translocator [Bacteroidales bacterium]|nr:LysE family translocator [Bacteroidales bacterium]
MVEAITYLFSGIVFGTVAGISPGPLLTLVISETVKHNKREGIKIAVSPFITDIPIVLISLLILSKLVDYDFLMALITFLGAGFILYLAYKNFTVSKLNADTSNKLPNSLLKGLVANILSPHPYLFWITVGGTILIKAFNHSMVYALMFLFGFYSMLVGSKILVAFLVDKSKDYLNSKWYPFIIRILGVVLIIFAIVFIFSGITYLHE